MKKLVLIMFMLVAVISYSEEADFKAKMEESGAKLKTQMEMLISGKVLAVVEFNSEIEGKGGLVSDFYLNYLNGGKIKIVDRKEITKVLDEIKLELAGITEGKNSEKLGNMLGANYLLTGNINKIADKIFVSSKVIEISSGVTIYSDVVSFKNRELETISKLEDFYKEKKYPATAAFRSVIIPGWGQLYNDEPVKGALFTGTALAGSVAALYFASEEGKYRNSTSEGEQYKSDTKNANDNHDKMMTAIIGTVVVWGWNVVDALINAK